VGGIRKGRKYSVLEEKKTESAGIPGGEKTESGMLGEKRENTAYREGRKQRVACWEKREKIQRTGREENREWHVGRKERKYSILGGEKTKRVTDQEKKGYRVCKRKNFMKVLIWKEDYFEKFTVIYMRW